jgi:glucose/arabinose dehydrogenase
MGRALLTFIFAMVLTACGDPLIIVGDLPGFMRIAAGVGDSVGTRLDSLALRTRLTRPSGIAAASTGTLYFADESSRVFSVTSAGRLTLLHSSIGCTVKTCLGRAAGVALTPDGSALIIGDGQTDKIWRLNIATREIRSIAGTGVHAVAPDGTPAVTTTLSSPHGVAVLPDGRILFAERNANRIRVIGTDGILGTFKDSLAQPTGLAYADNTVYVTETQTHTVRAIDVATGNMRVIAGRGAAGFTGDGGAAVDAALNAPWGVAVSEDNVFISDQLNHRVRSVNLTTGIITTFAGTGAVRYTGNGRPAAETSLSAPTGLAVSPFGYLYIADYGHSVIWRTPIRAVTKA